MTSTLLDSDRAPSTVKVYIAAISYFHEAVVGATVGRHPLVSSLLRGAYQLRPSGTPRALLWDLPVVRRSLMQLMELSSVLTHKTAFLLAVCSARRVSELHALSVSETCLR